MKTFHYLLGAIALLSVACANPNKRDKNPSSTSTDTSTSTATGMEVSDAEGPRESLGGMWQKEGQVIVFSKDGSLQLWKNKARLRVVDYIRDDSESTSIQKGSFVIAEIQPTKTSASANLSVRSSKTLKPLCQEPVAAAQYKYQIEDGSLILEADQESCEARADYLGGTWEALENPWKKMSAEAGEIEIEVAGSGTRQFSYEPKCSGLDEDNDYSFWVREGSSENWLVAFSGGGACWHTMNCIKFTTYDTSIGAETETKLLLEGNGILNLDSQNHLFEDWNMVWIPFCTGDIHWGSNDTEYEDPETQEKTQIHHRGFDNFLAVLKYLRENVDREQERDMLVTGFSAGGFGALLNFPYLRESFPEANFTMLNDAASGVITNEVRLEVGERWQTSKTTADWLPGIDANDPSTVTMDNFVKSVADFYPEVRVAHYTTAFDDIQIRFLKQMQVINNPVQWAFPGLRTSCDWNKEMLEVQKESLETQHGNYRIYIAGGKGHGITLKDEIFSHSVNQTPFYDWVGGLLSADDSVWKNVICKDCDGMDSHTCSRFYQ